VPPTALFVPLLDHPSEHEVVGPRAQRRQRRLIGEHPEPRPAAIAVVSERGVHMVKVAPRLSTWHARMRHVLEGRLRGGLNEDLARSLFVLWMARSWQLLSADCSGPVETLGMTRRFIVVCGRAIASGDFRLDDLPGSGRLDVGLRCIRAALLISHGVRREAVVYLVLRGGARAPRVLRITGRDARFVRPDERSLAVLAQKALTSAGEGPRGFVDVRPGVAVANGDLEEVVADLGSATPYVLERGAPDLRDAKDLGEADVAFLLGDDVGLDEAARLRATAIGARPLGVGPVAVHAEDAITIVSNELDRREAVQQPVATGERR